MTLETAIQILQHKVNQNVFQVDPDAFTALKLAIEVLIGVQTIRRGHPYDFSKPLPGETKD